MKCKHASKAITERFSSLARLPKWFGERPGKKAGDADTPEGEEDVKADEDILDDEDAEEVEEVVEEGMNRKKILCGN